MKYQLTQEQKESIERNKWLTIRERRIFELFYRDGIRIEDIAAELDIARSTVSRELQSIRGKVMIQK